MKNYISKWDYNQFLAFTLLYLATTDHVIKKEEKEFIKSRTGDTNLSVIRNVFDNMSDYEIIQTIMSFKEKFFNDERSKNKMFDDMITILKADKDFTVHEESLYIALKNLLDSL